MSDHDGFVDTYLRHVAAVQADDLATVMADLDPAAVPEVFRGVTVPRAPVLALSVVGTRVHGELASGSCVYDTAEGRIGLRSTWRQVDGTWLAFALENFPVESAS